MKKALKWLGLGIAVFAAFILLVVCTRSYSIHHFAADWQTHLPTYKDSIDRLPAVDLHVGLPGDAKAPEPLADAKLVKFRFPDGSWLVAAFILLVVCIRSYSIRRFAADWQARLPAYKDSIDRLPAVDLHVGLPGDAKAPEPLADAKLVKFRFPDGSWLVAAEHDTHDEGLEWDMTVFYDSRGAIHTTRHHFCGWEGLLRELSTHTEKAGSLDDFYKEAAPIL